jgi:GDP-4-dehydro-6-deoxy-D-mannose reductase
MRVLVTGATGFTGRRMVAVCEAAGAEVVAVGRREADLTDAAEAARAVAGAGADLVAHLAADVSVPRSWNEPRTVLHANHVATLNLLDAVREHTPGAGVLVACSSEEYGPPARLPVTEEAPLNPQNPYATSKATSDVLAGFYGDAYDLRVVRARAFNHAGPGQRPEYVASGFARQIALAEREGASEVTVATGNTEVRRDFVDVRDVARAYWSLLGGHHAGVYNVCSGRSASIADILAILAELTPLEVHRRTDPGLLRQHEVMDIVGSHERLSNATGWAPEVPLERTLADTLDWWRREPA